MSEIYIGIDGGGTHTRAIAVDRSGRLLARAEGGGANPSDTPDAEMNVHGVIREVVARAGGALSDVAGLVAGLAGVNSNTESQARDERFAALDGLSCSRVVVNDAVVAHSGALHSRPGIIAIGGTGSIVFGVNEAGVHLRNYDARHWEGVRASFMAYDAIHRLIAGDAVEADEAFTQEVCAFWEVDGLTGLRELGADGFLEDRTERDYRFGEMAQRVTDAASAGSPLAQSVCDDSAAGLCVGIRIVGARFSGQTLDVVLIGGVVRSAYMQEAVARRLRGDRERQYTIVEPAFPPEIGAAMMALEYSGIAIDSSVLQQLSMAV